MEIISQFQPDYYNLRDIRWMGKGKATADWEAPWAWTYIRDRNGTLPILHALAEDIEEYGSVESMGFLLTIYANRFIHKRKIE